ncbi:MAG: hypothetical protein ACLVJ6_17320 [Merdibacter sp.]
MIVMDTITGNEEVDTSSDFFGTRIFAGLCGSAASGRITAQT